MSWEGLERCRCSPHQRVPLSKNKHRIAESRKHKAHPARFVTKWWIKTGQS